MFKGFSDSSRNKEFHGFPNLNFQMNNEAYGFSGCTFWLDAASGLNTQTNGANISSWRDKVMGVQFTQATAGNQPTFTASNVNFNGLPSVQFDSTRLLTGGSVSFPEAFTICFVCKVDANSSVLNRIFSNTTTAGIQFCPGGLTPIGLYTSTTPYIQGTTADALPHIIIISSSGYNQTCTIIVDGVLEVTGSIPNVISTLSVLSGSTANYGMRGSIAEIILFNNYLDVNSSTRLSDNINSKYAIY
jgi:hypothetical protein